MAGLIILFILCVWFFIVLKIVKFGGRKVPDFKGKEPVGILVFLFIFVSPVGGWQFRSLCERNSDIFYEKEKVFGKKVYYKQNPYIEVKGTWVPIQLQTKEYVDLKTGEIIIHFNTLKADGGWLKHVVPFTQEPVPILFSRACGPSKNAYHLFKILEVTVVN